MFKNRLLSTLVSFIQSRIQGNQAALLYKNGSYFVGEWEASGTPYYQITRTSKPPSGVHYSTLLDKDSYENTVEKLADEIDEASLSHTLIHLIRARGKEVAFDYQVLTLNHEKHLLICFSTKQQIKASLRPYTRKKIQIKRLEPTIQAIERFFQIHHPLKSSDYLCYLHVEEERIFSYLIRESHCYCEQEDHYKTQQNLSVWIIEHVKHIQRYCSPHPLKKIFYSGEFPSKIIHSLYSLLEKCEIVAALQNIMINDEAKTMLSEKEIICLIGAASKPC